MRYLSLPLVDSVVYLENTKMVKHTDFFLALLRKKYLYVSYLVAYLIIYPPITRERTKRYNERVWEFPATSLLHRDGGISLSAFSTV